MDKHIRKLDIDLAHFEAEIKEKLSHRRSAEYSEHKLDLLSTSHLKNQSLNISHVADKRKKKKTDQPAIVV